MNITYRLLELYRAVVRSGLDVKLHSCGLEMDTDSSLLLDYPDIGKSKPIALPRKEDGEENGMIMI